MALWMIFAALCVLDCLFFKLRYKRRNGPPVWCGFPFIGYAPFLMLPKTIYMPLFRWYLKQAPDVVLLRHFTVLVIAKNEYVKIVEMNEACLSRSTSPTYELLWSLATGSHKTHIFDHGYQDLDWKSHRKVNVMALYNLSKREIFSKISDTVDSFLMTIQNREGEVWKIEHQMTFAKFQESAYLNLGKTFEFNNLASFINVVKMVNRIATVGCLLSFVIPLRMILFFGEYLPRALRPKTFGRVYKELLRRISETKIAHGGGAKDYIEAVMRVKKTPEEVQSYLRSVALFNTAATTFTTQHAILTAVAHLAVNQDCQQKAFEEIQSVVGSSALTVDHLADLHYCKAVIHESYRISPPVTLLQRRTTQTTRYGDYDIPPNVDVTMLFYSEAYDEKYFKDPHKFQPNRFLDEKGLFRNDPNFAAFSRGKRMCPGVELANMSTVVFVAKILQHFEYFPASDEARIVDYDGGVFPPHPEIPLRFVSRVGAPSIKPVTLEAGLTALLNDVINDDIAGKIPEDT